jgi:formate hydrogenlyase subunit 4
MLPMASQEKPESTESQQTSFRPIQNFVTGFLLSGLPIFVYLSLSVDMTYGSLAAVGSAKLAVAAVVPVFCGLLAVFFKDQVISFLSSLLESANLPF